MCVHASASTRRLPCVHSLRKAADSRCMRGDTGSMLLSSASAQDSAVTAQHSRWLVAQDTINWFNQIDRWTLHF